jgi:hypothetical protein
MSRSTSPLSSNTWKTAINSFPRETHQELTQLTHPAGGSPDSSGSPSGRAAPCVPKLINSPIVGTAKA